MRTLVSAGLIAAGVWVLGRMLPVILVLLAALMLVGTLGPIMRWLGNRGLSRNASIAVVFSALLLGILLFGLLTAPALVTQAGAFFDHEPVLRGRLAERLSRSRLTLPLAEVLQTVRYGDLVKAGAAHAVDLSTRIVVAGAYVVSAFFLALYIMVDQDRLRGGLYALVPRNHHIRFSRILLNLEAIVGGYIRGQLVTSALMAVFVFLLLVGCGASSATSIAVAIFAAVADVLPYIGPFFAVGAVLLAVASKGPVVLLIALVLMLVYEEMESRLLLPRIYSRTLRLPSSVVFFSLLAGGTLLGIVGAFLALPVAAAIRMLTRELRMEMPGETETPRDVQAREREARCTEEYARKTAGMRAAEAAPIALALAGSYRSEESA
ncbi:AI-2E family transporter [Geothrix sp. 21YS21S-4]|uniref:AI-2E family transporter n=1 Tax=Geothrix sp. 21YS21S-4 TaxID=3068889 RepID=UPI0027B92B98|nr:AI-2E family transporter [Geothrix sp. 21YS21S-4]